ncbi:hypothetical protein CKW00_03590 [Salimicrobium humidisoli]|uniref:NERD domain-containing protein n=1 Tax=Salimicrobium humidisoli TaxID=2029857 RepID=A0ABX4HT69_9BACI|nr:hypothetical protein CKW00_03590 [Salimicrobium humidisoli]
MKKHTERMMHLIRKKRDRPVQLKILHALEKRRTLTEEDLLQKSRLEKGWEGEQLFDRMTGTVSKETLQLHDLRLNCRSSIFQLDTLLIRPDAIYLYEVKYYSGDFLYEDGDFKLSGGKVILNPMHQLMRARTLLHQLLEEHGYSFPVRAYVVFPHPHFFLYHAPVNDSFLFLPQWKNHLTSLSAPGSLMDTHHKLADLLCHLHKKEPPAQQEVPCRDLHKNLFCPDCAGPVRRQSRTFFCPDCSSLYPADRLIYEALEDFLLLFPEVRLTLSSARDWCRVASDKQLRRVLSRRFNEKGKGRGVHYV